ncbi:hypothetical protein ACHAPJ_013476 [Fusarium lateritium]
MSTFRYHLPSKAQHHIQNSFHAFAYPFLRADSWPYGSPQSPREGCVKNGVVTLYGDITEEHAHKDIDDAIAMGLDGFVLNVGYPKQDWVSNTLSHLYGYADYLAGQGSKFRLALSLDLYATGAWCYDKSLGSDCGGPKEYEGVLKSFLGRDSYFRYGPNNFPFITSFSTGNQTDKQFAAWKKSFANQMYFMPGIDDTPGFWESHIAWWDYWGDLIDGASAWESAWPEVHGTNEGDMSKDIKVMGPLQKKGKGYMILQKCGKSYYLKHHTSVHTGLAEIHYGANLYRRGEMNMIKRMQNILSMSPQPDIVQLLTWNDGPESHHFGNLWPEQNTDAQPNQYAGPEGSDHTGLQSLYSAFIHAWKNGGSMVPAFSKRDESLPQGALWHKSIFQDTTCPGGNSDVKYFQAPNGTDAGQDALHWALVVPANAAGWTVDVVSNGKSISSKVLQAGLNYGTIEDGIQEGTQRLVIQNGKEIVAGTDRGRCLAQACHDGIYNFNPQVMAVKRDYDNTDCWQIEGEPILDWQKGEVLGTTLGPRSASHNHGHDHDSAYHDTPFEGFMGCSLLEKEAIHQSWRDIVTILKRIGPFKPKEVLETRNFGDNIIDRKEDGKFIQGVFTNLKTLYENPAERKRRTIRISCKKDIPQQHRTRSETCRTLKGSELEVGGYAFDDATSSPGGTIVLCAGYFRPGQEHLAAVQEQLDIDKVQRKMSTSMTGKYRLLLHEMVHLPSVSNGTTGPVNVKEGDGPIQDQFAAPPDQHDTERKAYMPAGVERLARLRSTRHMTPYNADTVCGLPTWNSMYAKYCDHAVNSLQRNDDKNYGDGKPLEGNCWGDRDGYGCTVFVRGKGCVLSGNEMWWKYQDLRDSDKGDCSKCGSVHYGNGCRWGYQLQYLLDALLDRDQILNELYFRFSVQV